LGLCDEDKKDKFKKLLDQMDYLVNAVGLVMTHRPIRDWRNDSGNILDFRPRKSRATLSKSNIGSAS
jgi:hypothetical protein